MTAKSTMRPVGNDELLAVEGGRHHCGGGGRGGFGGFGGGMGGFMRLFQSFLQSFSSKVQNNFTFIFGNTIVGNNNAIGVSQSNQA